jgi:hypothetical protein
LEVWSKSISKPGDGNAGSEGVMFEIEGKWNGGGAIVLVSRSFDPKGSGLFLAYCFILAFKFGSTTPFIISIEFLICWGLWKG